MTDQQRTSPAGAPADGADEAMHAALTTLLDGTHLITPDRLPEVVAAAGGHLGMDVLLYLVTLDQRALVPWPPAGTDELPTIDVTDDVAGRAFRLVAPVEHDGDLWLPLLDGVERLGVLRFRPTPGTSPAMRPERLRSFDLLVGHLVAIVTPYGDTVTRIRGGSGRTVEAELLWNLLPPLTYATTDLVVSGLVEPCERVAGDVFDYAVEGTAAHVAIFDGSGHNLDSGLLSSVALAAYRSHRRRGADLVDCARAIDSTLLRQTDGSGYATGVLTHLDIATGLLRYVNAGHPRPVLLRGGRYVKSLDRAGRPLFGLGDSAVTIGEEQLEPGDQVVLYTDGIVEARDPDGAFFGLERLIEILERCAVAGTPAPETLRLAVEEVLAYQRDILQDDATMVLVEWGTTAADELDPQ